jgi:hypothetical protein
MHEDIADSGVDAGCPPVSPTFLLQRVRGKLLARAPSPPLARDDTYIWNIGSGDRAAPAKLNGEVRPESEDRLRSNHPSQ